MQPNAKKEFKALLLCQEVSETEEEIVSVPSFTSNNSSRPSKKSSEVAFDARLEYNSDSELELNPHGVRSTDSNVFSLSTWSRKSFGATQSQAQNTTPVPVDMRDDDELFAILEEADEEDDIDAGQNASERFSSFRFSVASFMPRVSSRPSQNPPSSVTNAVQTKDGLANVNNSNISGAHVDVENVASNDSVYVTENILHQTPSTSN